MSMTDFELPPRESDGPPTRGQQRAREMVEGIDRDDVRRRMEEAKRAIGGRIEEQNTARRKHLAALDKEAKESKNVHPLGRHGAQTGWEGQLLRICTKVTPDQDYDPHGILPIDEKLGEHTLTKPGKNGGEPVTRTIKDRTGGGVAAGVFHTPEVQDELTQTTMQILRAQVLPYSECEVQERNGTKHWVKFNFVHVYPIAKNGGSGVAYAKDDGFVKLDKEVVISAINDFMTSATNRRRALIDKARLYGFTGRDTEFRLETFLRETTMPRRKELERIARSTDEAVRFPTWGHLLRYLKVKQILRNGARVEVRLDLKTGKPPFIMTMMPETCSSAETPWGPTSFVADDKQLAARLKKCIWTGNLRSATGGGNRARRVVPPSWARAFPG